MLAREKFFRFLYCALMVSGSYFNHVTGLCKAFSPAFDKKFSILYRVVQKSSSRFREPATELGGVHAT